MGKSNTVKNIGYGKSNNITNFGYGMTKHSQMIFVFIMVACVIGILYFTIVKPFSKLYPEEKVLEEQIIIEVDEYNEQIKKQLIKKIKKEIGDNNAIVEITVISENFYGGLGSTPIVLRITIKSKKNIIKNLISNKN